MDISDAILRKKQLQDKKDILNQEMSSLNKEIDDIDGTLMRELDRMKKSGLDPKLSGHGISVYLTDKCRATYDPERWAEIVKWAVESGRDYIVQRRLSDKKIESLIEEGVELPIGLGIEYYPDISHRRA
jgi:hypothetical protein